MKIRIRIEKNFWRSVMAKCHFKNIINYRISIFNLQNCIAKTVIAAISQTPNFMII